MLSPSNGTATVQAPAQETAPRSGSGTDPYRGVILILLSAAVAGLLAALVGGLLSGNSVLLDVAVSLGISSGILAGVALAQAERTTPAAAKAAKEEAGTVSPAESISEPETAVSSEEVPATRPGGKDSETKARPLEMVHELRRRLRDLMDVEDLTRVRVGTGAAGFAAMAFVLVANITPVSMDLIVAALAAGVCFATAGLTAVAVRYFGRVEKEALPEADGLCMGGRVLAWILVLAGLSIAFQWAGLQTGIYVLHVALLVFNAALCSSLIERTRIAAGAAIVFPIDFRLLSVLGSRANIVASVLDAGERQLGIDLRSTWALSVARRSVEPLVIGLCFLGWLSTSFTVIGVEEQGLVERFGVPVAGIALSPGVHLHWPWPIDQVFRIPVMRVQVLTVGHEGQEEGGPENVLWARQHAANEYTLLLGNGRDLITIDAAVQFRISDARAWRYHTQNPSDALRAIAYRAVMRDTVNRTLSEALSENVVTLTQHMRTAVQQEADALGLGAEIVGFTVGGMHPPVAVAQDYQSVVSAELGKTTSIVNAQSDRNQNLPRAESYAFGLANTTRAEGAEALAAAAGEAWAFRALESQYRTDPREYVFRRRLETLEKGLSERSFTVVDSRFQRDGGELWVIP